MPPTNSQIQFEHIGIATAIKRNLLQVPANQREYKWEEKHILDLFQDITTSISSRKPSYFLGTIVLTSGLNNRYEVADGQQRLATTTILLSVIRDWYAEHDAPLLVQSIENSFLFDINRTQEALVPRLTLNTDDNEYFIKRILSKPGSAERNIEATKPSHRRIEAAADLAREHIKNFLRPISEKSHREALETITSYLEFQAQVVVLAVMDDLNAFVMFETLNDRGLKTSQADLVKNHLFGVAKDRMAEAQHKWSEMMGALEALGIDDIALTYLRHYLIARHGHTRERDVFEQIRGLGAGPQNAIQLLDDFARSSHDYVAILSPDHAKWGDYDESVRRSIKTIQQVRVVVVRPLMLALAKSFSPEELAKAFKQLVSWSVRFLIVGGGRGGTIEEGYGELARSVHRGIIKTAKDLSSKAAFIPNDADFATSFSNAQVSQAYLARYYLRALELTRQQQPQAELIPNEDKIITLEHILPAEPENNWTHINSDVAESLYKRIGNLCLLPERVNSDLRSAPFSEKKKAYKNSGFMLTNEISELDTWGAKEVVERQGRLAELALKTWPR